MENITMSNNSTTSGEIGESAFIVAGIAGGVTVLVLLICAVACITCRFDCCSSKGSTKKKKKKKVEPAPDVGLDQVVSTDNYKASSLVDQKAVERIHQKSNFNLKRLIGKALARQVESVLLDSSRLTLGDTLGEGNFGVVYKGILTAGSNSERDQVVAVKSISGDNISAKEMSSFIEEVLRMRHFNDDHVLSMIGLVIERNMPMIVMPFMSNGDLRSYVANPKNQLLGRDLVDCGRQVAIGMTYLSNQGFIHRDLAARNCMVDGKRVVKVADFGLSRDIFNADYYKGDAETPLPVRWMAVESLKKAKFSVKSDVWSYGVLLWELFTRGAKPYAGLDNNTVAAYVRSGKRLQQSEQTPQDLYDLMTQCWNENPAKRPTFQEISETLRRLMAATGPAPNNNYANLAHA